MDTDAHGWKPNFLIRVHPWPQMRFLSTANELHDLDLCACAQ